MTIVSRLLVKWISRTKSEWNTQGHDCSNCLDCVWSQLKDNRMDLVCGFGQEVVSEANWCRNWVKYLVDGCNWDWWMGMNESDTRYLGNKGTDECQQLIVCEDEPLNVNGWIDYLNWCKPIESCPATIVGIPVSQVTSDWQLFFWFSAALQTWDESPFAWRSIARILCKAIEVGLAGINWEQHAII